MILPEKVESIFPGSTAALDSHPDFLGRAIPNSVFSYFIADISLESSEEFDGSASRPARRWFSR